MPADRTAFLLLPLLGVPACAANPSPAGADSQTADVQSAAVTIDNQAAYDMDIYVHQRDEDPHGGPKVHSVNRPTQIMTAARTRYSPAVGSSPIRPRSQRAR